MVPAESEIAGSDHRELSGESAWAQLGVELRFTTRFCSVYHQRAQSLRRELNPQSSETGLVVKVPPESEIAALTNGELSEELNLLTPAEIQWETGFEPRPQLPGNFNGL